MKRFLSPGSGASASKKEVIALDESEDSDFESPPTTTTTQTKQQPMVPDFAFTERGKAPPAMKTEHELWADKYAPQSYDDLVGLTTVVQRLEDWLKTWDAIHLHKTTKQKPGQISPKAVLLSGPPGIGKSTSARLVVTKLQRDIFELNASDARSKKLVEEKLSDVVQASTVSFTNNIRRRVVIMDEVDGMSSSDRGGMQELIKVIKTTKCPIICICNDHGKSSVRSLAAYCLDLKFQRAQVPSIMKRMKQVCTKERVSISDEALEGIIKSSGSDIRQVLNALQMFHHSPSNNKTVALNEINKDAIHRLSGFDACKYIFCESHTAPLAKRNEAFFSDYDLIPLMVAQNYPSAVQNSLHFRGNDMGKMEALSKAADAVCDADVVSRMVRSEQRWDLLTSMAMLNLRIAHLSHGSIGFPNFPEWLGKNSNAAKRARMLSELCLHVKQSTGMMDKTSLRIDYVSALRQMLIGPLLQGNVEPVLELMDEYGMSRDDLFETLGELQFPESAHFPDLFKRISSNTKATFTREYNKRPHRSQMLVGEEQAATMNKGKKRARVAVPVEEGGEEEEEIEEEEQQQDNVEAFLKKKSGRKSTEKPSAAAASAVKTKKTTTTKKKQG